MGLSGQRAGHEPAPRVVAVPAPGHTPGHGFVRIISQGQELFCTTDMLGHEIQVEFSEWSMSHADTTNKQMSSIRRKDIKKGNRVRIVLKIDQRTGKLTEGIVKDILTKSSSHPHGIKVRLETGQVGRVKQLLEKVC
jgi:uncharacterized repeat protein (TIGR03833 family)